MKGFIFLPALLAFASGCVERAENHLPDQVIELDMGTEPGGDMDGEAALGEGEGAGTMEGTWLLVHENSSCILSQQDIEQLFPFATGENPSCTSPQQDLTLLLPLRTGENLSCICRQQDLELLLPFGCARQR